MPRYALTVEYDGVPFVGWQIQSEGLTVQGVLQEAIFRFCGERVLAKGAGRTDAGVHALGQVVHFDLEKDWEASRVREAINFHLKPHPVVGLDCRKVSSAFDARFTAKERHYLYRILNRPTRPVLVHNRVWWIIHPLDVKRMHEAAQHLVGLHDFTTFRAVNCQAQSPLKTLNSCDVEKQGNEIVIKTSARSFLHHQVRSMVGSLKLVGEGVWQPADLFAALKACDRRRCGPVAPACGLYLVRVDYSDERISQSTEQIFLHSKHEGLV
ncbi:MAG: tRNA pseudouridine(38-40) synthase TruA [Hyphomicrobium sp.]